MAENTDEVLFVGTAEAEHVEMYLKAIWHIKERNDPVKISTIAKMLHVRQPSVVQMLKKLNGQDLVEYNKAGVFLTESGENRWVQEPVALTTTTTDRRHPVPTVAA